jgi:hypothetical protein
MYDVTAMPKQAYTLKIDPELLLALRAIKVRDGISESEQIRRGIQLWLKGKGVKVRAERRQVAPVRKRP